MTAENILEESENLRVRLEYEVYANEPDNDVGPLIFRIDVNSYGSVRSVEWLNVGSRPRDDDDAIENAICHWSATPARDEWSLVEKYVRAYYGTTRIDTYYSGSYWYVALDTTRWREYAGVADGHEIQSDMLIEWRSWCEGEVYYYVLERRVREETITRDLEGNKIGHYEHDAWEEIEAPGSYYGYDYAKEEATAAYNAYLQENK